MSGENEVEVDQDAIAAEVAAVELPPDTSPPGAGIGGEAGVPGAPALVEPAASWIHVTPAIVSGLDLFVCPAWQLTGDEKTALADALAPALDQLFPGGLGAERWAPYFRLLVVAGGIVVLRYDRDTGKLKPLRRVARAAQPGDEEGAPIAPGIGPGAGGGFSTAGGGGTSH